MATPGNYLLQGQPLSLCLLKDLLVPYQCTKLQSMAQEFILQGLLCSLIALPLFLFYFSRRRQSLNLPPSPPSLPVIGNLHQYGKIPHRALHQLATKYGPLMYLQLGYVPTLIVSNAKMAQQILKIHDANFCTRPVRAVLDRLTYGGQGVGFAPYGEGWRQLRKVGTLELFTMKRVQSLKPVREEEVGFMVKTIAEMAAAGRMVNVSELVFSLFNNITCRQAFGIRGSDDSEYGRNKFYDQIMEITKLQAGFAHSDLFPWLRWLDLVTGLHARVERIFRFFDGFFEEQIDAHRRRSDAEETDFLSVLLRLQKEASLGFNLTDDQIKIVLLETIVGGSDTSASATLFAMLELMLNPRVLKKAQGEVRRVVGRKPAVEESDIAELPYIRLVVKEILRLHPPVPLSVPHENMREASIEGYEIPAKTVVFTNLWAIMRDPEMWEDPHAFWPERFEESKVQYKGQDFQFIPFSSGRRMCPGMNLAVVAVELALANLLHCFDWELPSGIKAEDLDKTETPGIVVQLKTPLLLKAVPVQQVNTEK